MLIASEKRCGLVSLEIREQSDSLLAVLKHMMMIMCFR